MAGLRNWWKGANTVPQPLRQFVEQQVKSPMTWARSCGKVRLGDGVRDPQGAVQEPYLQSPSPSIHVNCLHVGWTACFSCRGHQRVERGHCKHAPTCSFFHSRCASDWPYSPWGVGLSDWKDKSNQIKMAGSEQWWTLYVWVVCPLHWCTLLPPLDIF